MRRRARSAVAMFVLAVAAAHLGLRFLMDTARPDLRDPEVGWRLRLLARRPAPSVIALGTSRAQLGLCPAATGFDLFNFGVGGAGPRQQLQHLKEILSRDIRPSAVIVEVLPPLLYTPPSHPLRQSASPYYRHRLNLMSRVAANWQPWYWRRDYVWRDTRPDGWLPYFRESVSPGERAQNLAAAFAEYRPKFTRTTIDTKADTAVRAMIRLCHRHKIPIAFYWMPESPTFRQWYPPDMASRTVTYFRSQRVPFFAGAREWMKETDFRDGHHLLPGPALEFSRRFGAEVLRPWLGTVCATRAGS